MSKNTKLIIIISLTAAVLISGAVFAAVKFKKPVSQNLSEAKEANPVDNILANIAAPDVPKSDFKVSPKSDFKNYTHPGYGFSFDYPADWSADLFEDDSGPASPSLGGEVAVIQNSETGILIYIYPFDEPGPISKERILRDVPDMKIANGKQIKIAPSTGSGQTIDALSFDSDEREIGPTREVWFVFGGFLYQLSAAEGGEEALNKMIETWKFN